MFDSAEDFKEAWSQRIKDFDRRESQSSQESQMQLFSHQLICGNGYLVCKKLEGLIKDVFSFADISDGNGNEIERVISSDTISAKLSIASSSIHTEEKQIENKPSQESLIIPIDDIPITQNATAEELNAVSSNAFESTPHQEVSPIIKTSTGIIAKGTKQSQTNRPRKRSIPVPPKASTIQAVDTNGVRLTDFYPTFASIFPVAYNQLGLK